MVPGQQPWQVLSALPASDPDWAQRLTAALEDLPGSSTWALELFRPAVEAASS